MAGSEPGQGGRGEVTRTEQRRQSRAETKVVGMSSRSPDLFPEIRSLILYTQAVSLFSLLPLPLRKTPPLFAVKDFEDIVKKLHFCFKKFMISR